MFTPGFIFFKPKPTGLVVGLKLGNSGVISRQTILFFTSKSGNRNNYIRIEDMNYRKLFGQRVAVIHPKSNNIKGCNFHKTTLFDNLQSLSNTINSVINTIYHQKDFRFISDLSNSWYINHYQTLIAFIYSSEQKGLSAQKTQNIFIEFGHLSQYILSEIGYHLFEVNGQTIEVKNNQQKKLDDVRLSSTAIMTTANQSMKTEVDNIKQIALLSEVTIKQINGIEQTTYFNSHKHLVINLARRFETGIYLHLGLTRINSLINKIGLVSQYILKDFFAQHSNFESKVKLLELLIGDFADYKISYVANIGIESSLLLLLQNNHYYQLIDQSSSIASLSTTGIVQLISSRLTQANIEIPLNKAINLGGQTSTLYSTTYDLISKKLSESNTVRQTDQLAITINHGNNRQGFSRQPHYLIQHCGIGSEIILLPHTVSINNLTTQAYQVIAESQIVINKTFSEPIFLNQTSVTSLFLDLTQARIIYFSVDTQINQVRAIEKAIATQEIRGIINQVGEINSPFFTLNSKIDIAHLSEKKIKNIKIVLTETTNGQANQLILVEIANWDGLTTQLWDNIEESIWNVLN